MEKIYKIIRKLGINSNYKGYFFVADALRLAMDSEDEPIRITKNIYPYLVKKYEISTLNIEQNICMVINICWRMNRKEMVEMVGYPLICKPTNTEFIDIVAY